MSEDSPTQAAPGSEVFVSYASQDTAVANATVEALETHGIRCWIAPRDVRAGAQYADAIVRAITGAKALVLVLSANAVASSHVGKEIERASSKKRPIIALRIDAALLTPALEYFLSESQWIEAQPGKMEAAYAKLIDAIREPDRSGITDIPAVARQAQARAAPTLHPKSYRNRILLGAGVAVVAVTLAALWAANFWPAKQVTAERSTPAATTAVSDKSIAVLPFADMSEKKDQEYMADGIAEELLNLLAQVPDLKVIARTSSFAFKGQNLEIADIAKKLNVAHVLEGSVRKSANKLRITAQLIHAADSTRLWSASYDRPMADVLAVQEEIANAIVQALQIKFMGGTLSRRQGGTENLEAYQLYLRAGSALNENTRSSLDAAEDYLSQAIKLDPSFGKAWSRRATVVSGKLSSGQLPPTKGMELYREYTGRAIQLSPEIAEAHIHLSALHLIDNYDWPAAEREAQLAISIDPNDTLALSALSALADFRGDFAEAERYQKKAIARDPQDLGLVLGLASSYSVAGRHSDAEKLLRAVIEQQPGREWAWQFLSKTLLFQGKLDAAFKALEQEPSEGARLSVRPILLHAAGRHAEADAAMKKHIDRWSDEWAEGVAAVYAFRGDKDRAMEWLERAYRQKDPELLSITAEPLYTSLRDDPRFKAFVRDKLKMPVR